VQLRMRRGVNWAVGLNSCVNAQHLLDSQLNARALQSRAHEQTNAIRRCQRRTTLDCSSRKR
jgi:hypothetical protein